MRFIHSCVCVYKRRTKEGGFTFLRWNAIGYSECLASVADLEKCANVVFVCQKGGALCSRIELQLSLKI